MTNEQDNQFEKIARYLDGERNVELTPADREVLDEFNRNEAEISSQLDVELPSNTVSRIRRRMNAATPRRRQSVLAFKLVGAMGMAAAVILGIGLFWANSGDKTRTEFSVRPVQAASYDTADSDEYSTEMLFDAIQEQLALQEEAELLALLEPLYTDDTVELWNNDDEINGYTNY